MATLKTAGAGAVNCEFEGLADELKAAATATVRGVCAGIGLGDADLDLAGDVYLTRCYIKNKKTKTHLFSLFI